MKVADFDICQIDEALENLHSILSKLRKSHPSGDDLVEVKTLRTAIQYLEHFRLGPSCRIK